MHSLDHFHKVNLADNKPLYGNCGIFPGNSVSLSVLSCKCVLSKRLNELIYELLNKSSPFEINPRKLRQNESLDLTGQSFSFWWTILLSIVLNCKSEWLIMSRPIEILQRFCKKWFKTADIIENGLLCCYFFGRFCHVSAPNWSFFCFHFCGKILTFPQNVLFYLNLSKKFSISNSVTPTPTVVSKYSSKNRSVNFHPCPAKLALKIYVLYT